MGKIIPTDPPSANALQIKIKRKGQGITGQLSRGEKMQKL